MSVWKNHFNNSRLKLVATDLAMFLLGIPNATYLLKANIQPLQWSGTQSVWALPASLMLVLSAVSLAPLLSHPGHPCFLSIWSLFYFKPCTSSHPGSGMLYSDPHTVSSCHAIMSLGHITALWAGLLALLFLAYVVVNTVISGKNEPTSIVALWYVHPSACTLSHTNIPLIF